MLQTTDAVDHFGSIRKLAEALDISVQAVHQWGDVVPRGRAFELQVMTLGALTAHGSRRGKKRSRSRPKRRRNGSS